MKKGSALIGTFVVMFLMSMGGLALGDNYTSGEYAGNHLTSGDGNAFIGDYAGPCVTTGSYNVAVGEAAGFAYSADNRNVYVGYHAGPILNGSGCFAGGIADTVAVGFQAGTSLTSGDYNVFVGGDAGVFTKSGQINTFIGYSAGFSNVTGFRNTYLGNKTGYNNTSGDHNIFIGDHAGENEMGSYRLYIDSRMMGNGTGTTTPLIYGEFDNNIVKINGTLIMASDERLKKDIKPLDSSLDTVMHLRGVTYEWKEVPQEGRGFGGKKEVGLIAQEVERILPELVHTDSRGFKSVAYDKLVPVLIEAVKEQGKQLTEQNEQLQEKNMEIGRLEMALEMIEKRLAGLEPSLKTAALKWTGEQARRD